MFVTSDWGAFNWVLTPTTPVEFKGKNIERDFSYKVNGIFSRWSGDRRRFLTSATLHVVHFYSIIKKNKDIRKLKKLIILAKKTFKVFK